MKVDDERIGRVLETIQTVIDNTNGKTDNVSKAMRNTAKFIRNAIDGEMPDYENVEGEDCGERPSGEWIECTKSGMPLTEYGRMMGEKWYGFKCSRCKYIYKGNALIESPYCQECGAKMRKETKE